MLSEIASQGLETSLGLSSSRRFLDSLGLADYASDSLVFEVTFAF